jgi:hypothetical protein
VIAALCVERLDRGLATAGLRKEQLQEALVAELERLRVDGEPRLELPPAGGG